MIVSGAQVDIRPQLRATRGVRFAPKQQCELGVGLQTENAVDHLRAGFLQPLGPVDVRLFVEASQQLDDDGDLLAAARGLDQRLHQHRVDAGAVDGLLDRDHVGVLAGLADELDDRIERLIGMMQQDVVLPDRRQNVGLIEKAFRRARHERRILELGPVRSVDQRRQPGEVDRPVAAIQIGFLELELLQQQAGKRRRAIGGDFQPHGKTELPLRELALERLPQILDLFLVEPKVGIARHPELRIADDATSGEKLAQVRMDDRGKQDKAVGRRDLDRQLDHPQQLVRRLDDRDGGVAAERVAAGKLDDEIQALVDDLGKRVRRIEADRTQQRLDLAPEIVGDPGPLRGIAFGLTQQPYPGRGHCRQQLIVERAVDVRDQHVRLFAQTRRQEAQLMQRHTGRRRLDAELLAHPGHADLEEFIQIAADDAQEAQTFEQRDGCILRQGEDAPVEREQRKLAMDQRRRGRLGGRYWRHRDNEAPWEGRCGESNHLRRLRLRPCYRRLHRRRAPAPATRTLPWRRDRARRGKRDARQAPPPRPKAGSARAGPQR